MTDQFLAEIRIFGFDFAPVGWARCDGQLLPISQNTALFSLLGTNYGGDGRVTFALPNLAGSAPMHPGQSAGSPVEHFLGESGGSATVTLIQSEMPSHSHSLNMSVRPSDTLQPAGLSFGTGNNIYFNGSNPALQTSQTLPSQGAGQAHNNLMPYLTLTFCIALQGEFPPRG